jgi:hypothetical protein
MFTRFLHGVAFAALSIFGDHHRVSANASDTEPARLLAVFVVDINEENLTTNDKEWDENKFSTFHQDR